LSTRVENINSTNIEWAIQRAGFELDAFLSKFPKVRLWIEGEKNPTVKQLEGFTQKVHVPFGYMFLEELPQENIDFPLFRSGKEPTRTVSLNLLHTIQTIQLRQDWLSDYMHNEGHDKLDFIGKYSLKNTVQEVANDIRKTLNIQKNWASRKYTWEQALNYLTDQIEESGIIVTSNGIVGNNTHRKLDPDEFKGFVIINEYCPFIFINASDFKAAQMFTLVHELAHIWLGKSSGSELNKLLPSNDPIEVFCNKIAAEVLVPEDLIEKHWAQNKDFLKLSKIFKVSTIVIARRLLDLELITKSRFLNFYNDFSESVAAKKESQSGGGNFYATSKKRVSLRFAGFVNNAVKENKLLYRNAYKLTNLKGDTYSRFVREQLLQT